MPEDYVTIKSTIGDKTFPVGVPRKWALQYKNSDPESQEYKEAEQFLDHAANEVYRNKTESFKQKEQRLEGGGIQDQSADLMIPLGLGEVAARGGISALGSAIPRVGTSLATSAAGGLAARELAQKLHAPPLLQNIATLAGGVAGGLAPGRVRSTLANLPEDITTGNNSLSTALRFGKYLATPKIDLPPTVERFKGPADELAGGVNTPVYPPNPPIKPPVKVQVQPQAETPQPAPQVNIPEQTEPKLLNAAPIVTPPPTRPQLALPPASQDFWHGPGSIPIKPASENFPTPEVKVRPSSEVEQVPANTKSAVEGLPSGKALSVAPEKPAEAEPTEAEPKKLPDKSSPWYPYNSQEAYDKAAEFSGRKRSSDVVVTDNPQPAAELAKKAKIPEEVKVEHPDKIEEPKVEEEKPETKPHFTHEIIGKIAKLISGEKPEEKISMTEVGRYIHENEVGTYEPSKFGEGKFGAGRVTKTEISPAKKGIKEWRGKLIKQGIQDYIKEHPEEF